MNFTLLPSKNLQYLLAKGLCPPQAFFALSGCVFCVDSAQRS